MGRPRTSAARFKGVAGVVLNRSMTTSLPGSVASGTLSDNNSEVTANAVPQRNMTADELSQTTPSTGGNNTAVIWWMVIGAIDTPWPLATFLFAPKGGLFILFSADVGPPKEVCTQW